MTRSRWRSTPRSSRTCGKPSTHLSRATPAAVERALYAYLLGRLIDKAQARSGLAAREAERMAYDELHATRQTAAGDDSEGPEDSTHAVSATELARAMRARNAPHREAVLRHVAALRRLAERMRRMAR